MTRIVTRTAKNSKKTARGTSDGLKNAPDVTMEEIARILDGGEFNVICEEGVMVLTVEAGNLLEEWEFEYVETLLEDARRMTNSVDPRELLEEEFYSRAGFELEDISYLPSEYDQLTYGEIADECEIDVMEFCGSANCVEAVLAEAIEKAREGAAAA